MEMEEKRGVNWRFLMTRPTHFRAHSPSRPTTLRDVPDDTLLKLQQPTAVSGYFCNSPRAKGFWNVSAYQDRSFVRSRDGRVKATRGKSEKI